ncbi:MAG: ligase-associated DNA damage response endonuclease PdeM [Betaproteobacteria bacterium]
MNGSCRIVVAGEELWLLPERAMLWPAQRTLVTADPHFGKAAVFRAGGIPMPSGSTGGTLASLTHLIAQYAPERLLFLGDFFHGRRSQNDATLGALQDWRRAHSRLHMQLVQGNHDRHSGAPPDDLAIEWIADALVEGPFIFSHHPRENASGYVLSGHLHPAINLFGPGRDHVRLPCFVFGLENAILPAFGEFTGGAAVDRSDWQRVFVVTQECVFEL